MQTQLLGVLLGILFLALCYLHYKNNVLQKQIKLIDFTNLLNYLSLVGLTQMLLDKGVLSKEDYDEYSKTGKITFKATKGHDTTTVPTGDTTNIS